MNQRLSATLLVLLTTCITSIAQILYKKGADLLTSGSFSAEFLNAFFNYYLWMGIILYAISSVLVIVAFTKGEVSVLYPIIATSYVWVAILSSIFLSEKMNSYKWIGIALIIMGIIFINAKSETAKFVEAI